MNRVLSRSSAGTFGGWRVVVVALALAAAGPTVAQGPKPAPVTAAAAAASVDVNVLKGAWARPDGGYIILIKDIAADGTLEAMYFNPNLLPLALARATQDGATLRASFELRAGGYGGSRNSEWVAGRLNKQIADELGISLRTVKAPRALVMEKLGVVNAAELGRFAAGRG